MHTDETGHRPLLALSIRLAAVATLALMAAIIKYLSEQGVNLIEIMFWRQIVTVPLALGWVYASTGSLVALSTTRLMDHFRRGIYGLGGMVTYLGALTMLPLAEATTINFTASIWAVLLAMVLLKDQVGIWRWSAVIIGFAGVVIITQPGNSHLPLFGTAVALAGAFMVALISIQVADLTRTESSLTIVFYFALLTTPLLALAMPFVMSAHSTSEWLLLLAVGLLGTFGQLLLTTALALGKVVSVIVMDYSALVWATLYGWLIWGVLPATSTWLGAPLIVAAGLIITWREHVLARRRFVDQRQATGT